MSLDEILEKIGELAEGFVDLIIISCTSACVAEQSSC